MPFCCVLGIHFDNLSLFYVASTFHKSDSLLGVVAQIPLYSVYTSKHMHHIELDLHT
jgi:hypothetical protein